MGSRILMTLLLAIFVALLGMGIVVPIMPLYATELGATGTTLGLMVAGFSISRGILQPIVGGWSDTHGKKRFIVAGLAVFSLAGLAYTFAGSVTDLIVIRVVHGVGSAMIVPIAMSYVGELSPEGEEGRYMGYFNIALFSGIGAGPLLGGVFLDGFGMKSAFYAMSSLSALAMLLVVVLLPADRDDGNRERQAALIDTFRRMSHNARVVGILLSRMSTMLVMVPSMAFLPLLMERFMDASGLQIGAVIATRTLTNATLQTPFGRLADRGNRVGILLTGTLMISLSMFAVPLAGSFAMLLGLFAFLGTGEALVWPTLGALATEEGRIYGHGSMMGVFNMAMSVGIFFGSLAAGGLVDTVGISAMFAIVGAAVAAAAVGAALLMRTPSRAPAPRRALAIEDTL